MAKQRQLEYVETSKEMFDYFLGPNSPEKHFTMNGVVVILKGHIEDYEKSQDDKVESFKRR